MSLNRAQYPEFANVEGEPAIAERNPDFRAAAREAFAALCVVRKRAANGTRQRILLGEAAVELLYGRPKRAEEKDCDVVGYILSGKDYGYWLAEGKGDDLLGAKSQFEAAGSLLARRRPNPNDPNDPFPGPVLGTIIVTNRLRYVQWNSVRKAWIAYNGAAEEPTITGRLASNIAKASPTLQQDKVYLIDGPEGTDMLPRWAITPDAQPWRVLEHERRGGTRGQFSPVRIGVGTLELHFVS